MKKSKSEIVTSVNLQLRLAERSDFNYVSAKGEVKPRFGFFFFLETNGIKVMYVLDERIKKDWLLEQLRKGKVYVVKPTHPRNNLPGIKINN